MMAGLPDDHPSVRYYDGDYPGEATTKFAENLDEVIAIQGLADDVDRYRHIARESGGDVLELGCGTGRVLLPLARDGHRVFGVDISQGMVDQLARRIAFEPEEVRTLIDYCVGDVCSLRLDRHFKLIIYPFNGLSCILDRHDQQRALVQAARHLEDKGRLVIDLVNPLVLPLRGNDAPRPFFTRRNPENGNLYTRFTAMGPMRSDQCQDLTGWYDELDSEGLVRRTPYKMTWRLIFRYEIELMMAAAGLCLLSVEGDHRGNDWTPTSPKLFVLAEKRA